MSSDSFGNLSRQIDLISQRASMRFLLLRPESRQKTRTERVGTSVSCGLTCTGFCTDFLYPAVVRQNPIRPRNQQVVSASTSFYLV
jgi:hypothetical protein